MDFDASEPADTETVSSETVRVPVDRRKPGLKSIYHGMFRPRRRRVRRESDLENAFLDWHPQPLMLAAVAVLLLSVADGLLTVRLVSAGVHEINPLLSALVRGSPAGFALVKWLLTACGVIALVVAAHARIFRKLRGATVLYGVAAGYLVLVLYGLLLTVGAGM